jgi:hypothetical protein
MKAKMMSLHSLSKFILISAVVTVIAPYRSNTATVAVAQSTDDWPSQYTYPPINVTVFTPDIGEIVGVDGFNWIIDLALDANTPADNVFLENYTALFNDPANNQTFHSGALVAAPGLVVLLNTTDYNPDFVRGPLLGKNQNLAGFFQLNGVGMVANPPTINTPSITEYWSTWLVLAPVFGVGVASELTIYVVSGTAPAHVTCLPEESPNLISNVVRIPFYISGNATTPSGYW